MNFKLLVNIGECIWNIVNCFVQIDNKDDELLQHQKENQRLANNLNDVYRKLQDLQHAVRHNDQDLIRSRFETLNFFIAGQGKVSK